SMPFALAKSFPSVRRHIMAILSRSAPRKLSTCRPQLQLLEDRLLPTPVPVNVNVAANRHAISPYVYGVAHASTAQLADLNAPLNRNGGNNTSRYNWQLNADNRGSDWYFESI